jgi:hypothetical protein
MAFMFAYVLSSGCSEANEGFIGQWTVDKEDLKRVIEETYPGTAESIAEARTLLIEANQDSAWVFAEDNLYIQAGRFPSSGQFEIYDYGNDWVVIRLFPDPFIDEHQLLYGDANEIQKWNAMDIAQLIEHHEITSGDAPGLIGIKIVSDEEFREFRLVVENGRLTDKREGGPLFKRVD